MTNIEDYRFETKFNIKNAILSDVEYQLKTHPKIFSRIHECRFVNNIYFDTLNMDNYHDNVDGLSDRIKVRIRWYGDLFGFIERPTLEIKIKKGGLGRKISIPINSFLFDNNISIKYMEDMINNSIIPIYIREIIRFVRPTLINRYRRVYYLSADGIFRATLDNSQQFYKFSYGYNTFVESVKINNIILEVKYNYSARSMAPSVINGFLFRVTKNSKYVNGIELLNQVYA